MNYETETQSQVQQNLDAQKNQMLFNFKMQAKIKATDLAYRDGHRNDPLDHAEQIYQWLIKDL